FNGLTAYGGLFEVCKPKKGEKLFILHFLDRLETSLDSMPNCLVTIYVVGCAGSDQKRSHPCITFDFVRNLKWDFLRKSLDLMMPFNYKKEKDLKSALKRHFPHGIDMYFDNAGGEMLVAAVANMNAFGTIVVFGAISEYKDVGKQTKRIRIQGFLPTDCMNVHADFISTTSDHLRTGNMQALEDITLGLENIPSAFVGLFRGVKIADE
ncbi:nadph-dependent oxidoreductase 2-alkenal reductase, partial [Quercus suber]